MGLPNKTRGEYRPIYEALFKGRDYRALSADAKLCLLTIQGLSGAMGLKEWSALAEQLAADCSIPVARAKAAVKRLQEPTSDGTPWIEYEDGIVWLVRGLEFEPTMSPNNPKHRSHVAKAMIGMANAPILDRFRARYAVFAFSRR